LSRTSSPRARPARCSAATCPPHSWARSERGGAARTGRHFVSAAAARGAHPPWPARPGPPSAPLRGKRLPRGGTQPPARGRAISGRGAVTVEPAPAAPGRPLLRATPTDPSPPNDRPPTDAPGPSTCPRSPPARSPLPGRQTTPHRDSPAAAVNPPQSTAPPARTRGSVVCTPTKWQSPCTSRTHVL
jgi:hypothetical protein